MHLVHKYQHCFPYSQPQFHMHESGRGLVEEVDKGVSKHVGSGEAAEVACGRVVMSEAISRWLQLWS